MIRIDELFIDENYKQQAKYIYDEVYNMAKFPSEGLNALDTTKGTISGIEMGKYITNNKYAKNVVYEYNNPKLTKTVAGYIINYYACMGYMNASDRKSISSISDKQLDDVVNQIIEFENENPISKTISNVKLKK